MEPQGYMGYEGIMLMVEMTKELCGDDDDDEHCSLVVLMLKKLHFVDRDCNKPWIWKQF